MLPDHLPRSPDPDDGVDVTLIRWMLSRSIEERLAVLQGFVDSVAELAPGELAERALRLEINGDESNRTLTAVDQPLTARV